MGHARLGRLPHTRKWRQVVGLIKEGAGTPEIATATLKAAEKHLKYPAEDLVHSFWLLTQIPLAARQDNFSDALRQIGIAVSEKPTLLEVVCGFTDAMDKHLSQTGERTDLGEMAQMAAVESLNTLGLKPTRSFFNAEPEEVKKTLGEFSTRKNFGVLARDFFTRMTRRYLTYFLSRELSNHVGKDERFINIKEHSEFNAALEHHCRQASRIVEDFAGGWYSKANFEERLTPEESAKFIHIALKKIRGELAQRGDENV